MAKRHSIPTPLISALLVSATIIVTTEARAEPLSTTPQAAAQPEPAPAPAPAPAPGAYPYPPYPYPPPGYYPPPPGWQPVPPPAPALRFDSAAELPPDDEGLYEPGRKRRSGEDEWIPRSSSKPNTGKAGGILIGVGLGVALLGGVFTAIGVAGSSGSSGGEFSRGFAEGFVLPVGVTFLVLGGVSVGVGIPLYAVSR